MKLFFVLNALCYEGPKLESWAWSLGQHVAK